MRDNLSGNNTARQLQLPTLTRVRLSHFSLFAGNPNAEFSLGDGVLCLVGANGLGKSTLLSAINFCLTGTVPDPTRPFESMDEYYRFTRGYSGTYFKGRIHGSDEENAEITVWFQIGTTNFEVRRGLFEPEELRGLSIVDSGPNGGGELSPSESTPRRERHDLYTHTLIEKVGVSSFEEFVFL